MTAVVLRLTTRKLVGLKTSVGVAKRNGKDGFQQRHGPLRSLCTSTTLLGKENDADGNNRTNAAVFGIAATAASLIGLSGACFVGKDCSPTTKTSCEKQPHFNTKKTQNDAPILGQIFPGDEDNPNPLWPAGCNEKDVDAFIDQVIQDPSINIPQLPDSVERVIYKSTVRLVLNIFYYLLSSMHGFELLEHEVVLKKQLSDKPLVLGDWNKSNSKVDEKVLERVADQMLANKAVNMQLVPDAIERPLYINSLRLVFRLLDILAASFNLKVCGHALLLDFLPLQQQQVDLQNHELLTSPLTKIDMNKVREVARRHAGIVEEDKSELSFLQRWSIREEFLAQLHASIYALVLGIADDVLANTKITLLSDKITLDLVPCDENKKKAKMLQSERDAQLNTSDEKNKGSGGSGFDARSFVLGCGVGLTAAAAVLAAGR